MPGDEPLRIGLEVLCRTGNPYAYFEDIWNSLSFLQEQTKITRCRLFDEGRILQCLGDKNDNR